MGSVDILEIGRLNPVYTVRVCRNVRVEDEIRVRFRLPTVRAEQGWLAIDIQLDAI